MVFLMFVRVLLGNFKGVLYARALLDGCYGVLNVC